MIKRSFLNESQCQEIIEEYEKSPVEITHECCPHAFTGENIYSPNHVKRATEGTSAFNLIHSTVEKLINEYHDYLDTYNAFHVDRRLTLLHPHLYRLMKYEKGAWIHPHTDHDHGVYGSCTINLNNDYEGGEFAFWGGQHQIKLNQGDAMIWPADFLWVHEVKEITSGARYSVNCFLRDSPQFLPDTVEYNIKVPTELLKYRFDYFKENRKQIQENKLKGVKNG